ncbi:MAG: cyclophane-forming radical SAM/SPASM peptide maturase GrrM/OscB [Pseudorhodoplanes sp.]|uniref:cyclophane-forming radical SAM/SPASM peptide maturase GrrM/OscB n=1 Tax=Pseudorhodoplanes sp. TaxID=1934341 RepID=UPI003D0D5A90
MISADHVGPLELLVVQPTPFCNLDCTYCYLPDRLDKRKITIETLEKTFNWAFSSGLVRQPFTLLWHAGEPMVLPASFYEDATLLLERCNTSGVEVTQSLQTNATLVNDAWCDFLRRRNVQVGVSVDGPDFLNDRSRKTRNGSGTLDRILRGMQKLREHEIFFDVITVLTSASLDYPDELFDFYIEHGITDVAFNVEEIEGPHVTSSLAGSGTEPRFRRFYSRFMDLALASDPPLRVREFETSRSSIAHREQLKTRTQECRPFGILNVDCTGNFSTYSPELLGLSSPRLGRFALGNVATDSLDSVLSMPRFIALDDEIRRGVDLCKESCRYYPFCGGGPPGNKYFENGDFATTETMSCRLHKKATFDVALDKFERIKAAM